eukprot:16374501-Heterocapsa_arctica.AAC.1
MCDQRAGLARVRGPSRRVRVPRTSAGSCAFPGRGGRRAGRPAAPRSGDSRARRLDVGRWHRARHP